MKKILFSLMVFFMFVCCLVSAEPKKCEGMCGYKFGQVISSWDFISDNGVKMKLISPAKKFMSFGRYFLSLTPKTQKVCAIHMLAEFKDMNEAKNEFSKVDKILVSHYGAEGKTKFNILAEEKEYHINGGEVIINLTAKFGDSFSGELRLTAISTSLALIGTKEADEVLINDTDTSALD